MRQRAGCRPGSRSVRRHTVRAGPRARAVGGDSGRPWPERSPQPVGRQRHRQPAGSGRAGDRDRAGWGRVQNRSCLDNRDNQLIGQLMLCGARLDLMSGRTAGFRGARPPLNSPATGFRLSVKPLDRQSSSAPLAARIASRRHSHVYCRGYISG